MQEKGDDKEKDNYEAFKGDKHSVEEGTVESKTWTEQKSQ